uniref:CHK domain-containing protein n=1 Tax=Steinernema glaseri TaxID=37863 RepID=A0A1I7YNP1_9BILA
MLKEAAMISFTTSLLDKAVQMKPEMLEGKIKPLYEACKNKKYHRYVLYEHCEEAGIPPVLVHGDMWSNNIMWKLDENGILVCCSDAEVRREYEDEVLKYYYDTLTSLFKKDNKEVPFTFEQVEQAYTISQIRQTGDTLWMAPLFCGGEKRPGSEALWEARKEKLLLRASLALDDALKTLEALPREKYVD